MGLFGNGKPVSTTPSVASRSDKRLVIPLSTPASESKPVSPTTLNESQEVAYHSLLTYCKTLETTEMEKFWLTKECLLRYLRATKWDLEKAKVRIEATLKWRKGYGVENLSAELIEPEAVTGKQVLLGFDVNARPVLYLYPSRQNTEISPRQIQYLVWGLERAIDLMGPSVENLALCVNYKGSSGDKNPGIGQGREVLSILQTHYVETLGRALVINIPFMVWGFFKLITPFIDPLTREKMKFNEDLRLHIPPSQLDASFGGDLEFEYNHEKYWPALVKLCDQRRQARIDRWKQASGGIGSSEFLLRGGDERDVPNGAALPRSSDSSFQTAASEIQN